MTIIGTRHIAAKAKPLQEAKPVSYSYKELEAVINQWHKERTSA